MDGILATMHRTDIEKVIAVNLTAPVILTKYVSRGMLSAREGRIVNISSIAGQFVTPGAGWYGASKFAVEAISDEIVVMFMGKVVEQGLKDDILSPPYPDYTKLLLSSVPEMDPDWLDRLAASKAS